MVPITLYIPPPGKVEWVGSVEPLNAEVGDHWRTPDGLTKVKTEEGWKLIGDG